MAVQAIEQTKVEPKSGDAAIVFEDVVKEFPGAPRPAVNHVSLSIKRGHLVVLLGPSGCGKTTLMKMVNRLYEMSSGYIYIEGTPIYGLKLEDLRRRIGYVIQDVGLFPHMRVERNIAVVPNLLGWDKCKIDARIDELLKLVGLPPEEYRRRYPRQLSGGQQQRVGIARAMAADPSTLLMDEPFAAIDSITRTRLQDELLRIQRTVRKTILFVTHDVEEALRLADEIVIMQDGAVVQYDTPLNILTRPANQFVSQLVGAEDVLRRLSLLGVDDVLEPLTSPLAASHALTISLHDDLRHALGLILTSGSDVLRVVDDEGNPHGQITLAALRQLTSADHISPPPLAEAG
ncbi:MAG: ABC transporter ATP-binding protein [Candidatus Chloroheliales bacterium]|nr:MAG: ABC transporter ATP-binding protein [Chloroflexota bacterium]